MGLAQQPFDNIQLAEMEFYLIEELEFHFIVFHPYRSLVQLCGRDGCGGSLAGEAEVEEKERRESMLDLDDTALQMAWCVVSTLLQSTWIGN